MPNPTHPGQPASGRGLRRIRILYPLILLLVLVGLVPLLAAAWNLIGISREALITAQQSYQLQATESIARQIDARLESLRGQLRQAGRMVATAQGTGGLEEVRRFLREAGGLGAVLGDGFLAAELEVEGGRFRSVGEFFDRNPAAAVLLAEARQAAGAAEGVAWIGPHGLERPEGPAPVAALAVALGRGGDRPGALAALVDLEEVWKESIGLRLEGYTLYILDPEGNLFARRDPAGLLARVDHRSFDLVRKFLAVGTRSKETSDFRIEVDGEVKEILGSFDQTELGWGVFAQVERQLAYSSVREMVGSTWKGAIAAFAMAIGMGLAFAASLSRPIRRLAASSRAFAGGDFSVRVRAGGGREIADLAETFNSMAEAIQNYIQRLGKAARENSELFLGTIKALAAAIDEKDPYTRGHSERVNQYAVALAKQMGLSDRDLHDVHVASLLHDVGKIGVDDRILLKPAGLTAEEFEIMKRHPVKGANMLASIKNMKGIIPGLLHHHERFSGGGYPRGLRGPAIPLIARIITVADTFDAMTTNRPYQRAMTTEMALGRLDELAGEALDPAVVRAFHEAVRSGRIQNLHPQGEAVGAAPAASA